MSASRLGLPQPAVATLTIDGPPALLIGSVGTPAAGSVGHEFRSLLVAMRFDLEGAELRLRDPTLAEAALWQRTFRRAVSHGEVLNRPDDFCVLIDSPKRD